jgi:D-erythronate 2-dehydrogenase
VAGWPMGFRADRAWRLGFRAESSFDDIIRIYLDDERGGRLP